MTTPILYLHEHGEVSGGETSLLLLWEDLDRKRFQPVLAGPASGPFPERARRLNVPGHAVQFPRFRDLLTRGAWRQLAAVERVARQIGPRIVHGNTPHTNLAAAWIGRRLPCRVVWHERTLPTPGEWDADRWLHCLADRIICNSRAAARRFRQHGARVVVVHNGVPLRRFLPGCGGAAVRLELGLVPQEVAIGIVGNFSPAKRHEFFLQAAARVAADLKEARFFLVGGEVFPENRGREAALRAETRRLGLEERVRFLGVRSDMPAIMDALDILVSTCEVEACSRAILEAMAAGTPVIGADAGGTPELIVPGETGLLFSPGDAAALASAIRRLAQDPPLRQAMGKAARGRAETEFSIGHQVNRIEAVYESLLVP